ncbi:MAG TPA: hypothetical protein VFV07_14245 [Rhizomicrobium sp.]|nr:hypothetical protein [Rhizomicrobium sp.]
MSVRMPHQAGIWLEADDKAFVGDMSLSIRAETAEAVQAILKIASTTDASLEKGDVVGSMCHSAARKASDEGLPQRAMISFEVLVPAKFMGSILRHTRGGRPPQKVWLDVKGLGYRETPRRKSAPLSWPRHVDQLALPITDMSLEFSHRRQTDFSLMHAEPDSEDPKVAKKASARALQRLEPLWVQLSVRIVWVVWLVVVVVVGLALWFWS